ncbi:fibrobacter succinogenes major paralogous domain-containing protein, partial [Candidatus Vampirococcus lugosii]
ENYDPYGLNLGGCERYTEQNIDWQGQEYNAVEIGGQIWFTENLNYDYGDSVCFGYNEENCDSYGRLYSKDDVQEDDVQGSYLCPDGWRVPSDDDWKVLEIYLSGIDEIASELDTDHSFFSENFDRLSSYDIKNKLTNQLNFNFGGIFSPHSSGTRRGPSTSGRYRASDLWQRGIDHDKLGLRRSYVDSDIARYSVRCMKDNENEDEDDEDEDETCGEDGTSAFDCTNMNNENSCKNGARKECCEWTGSMCISK